MPDETRADVTAAARTLCDVVRSTLGPFGATKLVIEGSGSVTTTSSGSAVLERIDIDNPTLRLLAAAAEDVKETEGDGTTAFVALVGALLEEADRLGELGVEPATVERGYREALDVAVGHVAAQSRPLSDFGTAAVARTALTGTRNPAARGTVADYLDRVIDAVRADRGTIEGFDAEQIKVLSRIGGAQAQSELVRGVVMDHYPVAEGMPRSPGEVGVALFTSTVDVPKVGGETDRLPMRLAMRSASFEQRAEIGDREREAFEAQLESALNAGMRFIATERAINERVKTALANAGVLAIQRVDYADLKRLSRATGAALVPGLEQVTPETVGRGRVAVRRRAGRDFTVVEGTTDEPVYTVFVRAPDVRSAETFEGSVEAAVAAALAANRGGGVVPGGGAIEMSASHAVREHAREVAAREQLAVEAFADALEVVPRTLAENGGLDGWTAVIRLHVAHSEDRRSWGVDSLVGEVVDVLADEEDPIVEPAATKRAILEAATDVAIKLVRIDRKLPATDLSPEMEEPGDPEDPISEATAGH